MVGRGNVGNKLRAQYCPISSTDVTTAIQFPRVTTTTSVDSFQDVQPILEQRALVPLRSHSLRHAVLDEEIWVCFLLLNQISMQLVLAAAGLHSAPAADAPHSLLLPCFPYLHSLLLFL